MRSVGDLCFHLSSQAEDSISWTAMDAGCTVEVTSSVTSFSSNVHGAGKKYILHVRLVLSASGTNPRPPAAVTGECTVNGTVLRDVSTIHLRGLQGEVAPPISGGRSSPAAIILCTAAGAIPHGLVQPGAKWRVPASRLLLATRLRLRLSWRRASPGAPSTSRRRTPTSRRGRTAACPRLSLPRLRHPTTADTSFPCLRP